MSARPSHAARLEASPRLRALLSALLKAGDRGLTALQIYHETGTLNAHSCAHELRENGYRISCRMEEGRRFRYRIEGARAPEQKEFPMERIAT